jgi:predicted ATP-grasp superfamily ATP-dependent carboligase
MEDLAGVPGVEPLTILPENVDYRCSTGICRRIRAQDEDTAFRECAQQADYSLIIAPEFQDILRSRTRWAEELGGKLLGSSSAGVQLTADKLALARFLQKRGVPTPESFPFHGGETVPGPLFPMVLKPRYGAGSQATFLVERPDELRSCMNEARAEGWAGEMVMQRFVPGRSASVAFLAGRNCLQPLLASSQSLSQDGRFRYQGGSVPLPPDLAERAVRVARPAVKAVHGLRGYVGVDMILGDTGSDCVIEINPRVTTSYIGLRAVAETNLAGTWIGIATGKPTPRPTWRCCIANFQAEGKVVVRGQRSEARGQGSETENIIT